MNWRQERKAFWLGVLLLLFWSLFTSSLAHTQDLGRYYALVIGNRDYRYFAPVPTAHAEAQDLARILEGRYGFEVETILNADRNTIMEAFSRISQRIQEGQDSLLVYYAGHSVQERYSGANAWLPVDAEPDIDLDWISTSLVSNILNRIRAKHILVITEGCYSNRLQNVESPSRPESPAEQLQRLLENPSFTALSLACDMPPRTHRRTFAQILLQVLHENQHVLSGKVLASRIQEAVQYGYLRATQQKQGDFLFIPKHLHSRKTPVSPERTQAPIQGAVTQQEAPSAALSPRRATKAAATQQDAPSSASPVIPKKGDVMIHKPTGMEFVYVPEGCFSMGASYDDPDSFDWEHPAHEVCVAGFWMGKYEVTQGQWKALMQSNPSGHQRSDQHPVENVSWEDVQAFLASMNRRSQRKYRLPTEAEWEYACRGGGPGKYCGGDHLDLVAWYEGNSSGRTQRVGTKRSNGFGLHDMSGNVWEWCSDRFSEDYYEISIRHNPQGPQTGEQRVVRGGSLGSSAANSRASFRFKNVPDYREDWLGFRVLMEQ
jgi:formylglycine-generating enzyme required for sulfatase activity